MPAAFVNWPSDFRGEQNCTILGEVDELLSSTKVAGPLHTSGWGATECPSTRPCAPTAIWIARNKIKPNTRKAFTGIYTHCFTNVVDLLESRLPKMTQFRG